MTVAILVFVILSFALIVVNLIVLSDISYEIRVIRAAVQPLIQAQQVLVRLHDADEAPTIEEKIQ